jgi:hypothetical protein
MKGNSEEARTINSQLELIKSSVFETEKKLYMVNLEVNYENFRMQYINTPERTRTLIPIFQDHNNKIKALVGKEFAPGTLERYETSLRHTQEFLQWKYNVETKIVDKTYYVCVKQDIFSRLMN